MLDLTFNCGKFHLRWFAPGLHKNIDTFFGVEDNQTGDYKDPYGLLGSSSAQQCKGSFCVSYVP